MLSTVFSFMHFTLVSLPVFYIASLLHFQYHQSLGFFFKLNNSEVIYPNIGIWSNASQHFSDVSLKKYLFQHMSKRMRFLVIWSNQPSVLVSPDPPSHSERQRQPCVVTNVIHLEHAEWNVKTSFHSAFWSSLNSYFDLRFLKRSMHIALLAFITEKKKSFSLSLFDSFTAFTMFLSKS